MLIFTNPPPLAAALAPAIAALLACRRDQLGSSTSDDLAQWIIVEPGDTLAAVETAVGFPLAPDPPWEWVLDHDGLFEAPIILTDDGFAVIIIVPDTEGIDPALLALARDHAEPANPSELLDGNHGQHSVP